MFDCIVIGAGLAGLTTAHELQAQGRDVIVLEARDRVGGRIDNATLSDGQVVELGGQWIAAGHRWMLELINALGLSLIDPQEGDVAVRLRGRRQQMPTREEIDASLNPFGVADLGQGLARFRRLAERIANDGAWSRANATWLGQPITRWIHSNLRTPGGQEWFRRCFAAAFAVDADEVTLLEGLHRANGGVDMEALVAVNGGLRQQRVEGGVLQVCQRLAGDLGDRIRLSTPVARIEQRADRVLVTTRISAPGGEQVFEAAEVVVAVPPKLATRLDHEPPLPPSRRDIAGKVPEGNVIKAVLVYTEPWWRRQGHSGQMGADDGAVRVSFDNSLEGGRGVLVGYFDDTDHYGHRSVALRQRAFAESVAAAFGDPGQEPVEYVDRDWSAEEFTGGCHGAHFAPGIWTVTGPVLSEPFGRVHFAGAEYAAAFNGYMEGALRSGTDTAAEVLRRLS